MAEAKGTVTNSQGIYIFTDSKPIGDYDYLGTVANNKVAWCPPACSGDLPYQQVIAELIRLTKKKFPAANAIIFDGWNGADAITLKQ
jgi:hypothetical protein